MKIGCVALFSFVSACSFLTSNDCWAGDNTPFGSFPESCASEAQIQYDGLKEFSAKHPRRDGQGMFFWDHGSPTAQQTNDTWVILGVMQAPVGELLYRGISNDIKPRLSNRASKQAERIGRAYDTDSAVVSAHVDFEPLLFTRKLDQYTCVTDTCPQGALCTTLNVKKEADELLAALPAMRRHTKKMFRWAASVKIFGSKVARLEQAYDRNEAELKERIAALPSSLVLIHVTVPIN